jgi:hemoglobin/transferrin/lactoferrin receptor protein
MTRPPLLVPSGRAIHGSYGTFFSSADAGYGSSLSTSLGTRKVGLVAGTTGSRVNTLKTGRGLDSHSAVTRFLGLRSDVLGNARLPDTGFTQYGGLLNLLWMPKPTDSISVHYQRGQQDGAKRYDQLLGGDGNLIADLRNLMIDFFYVRYDTQRFAWFNNLTVSYSLNTQREERVNQGGNGNPRATIVHEYERTRAQGIQVRGDKIRKGHQLRIGAEFYREGVRAPAYGLNPVTGISTWRRPRIPDHSRYRSWGLYAQDVFEPIGHRLKLVGGLRYSGATYRARVEDAPVVGGRPLWPSDSLRVHDLTGRGGMLVHARSDLSFSFHFSRGFRAPHITDLGTLGVTGSGFEVAEPEASRLGGLIGSTAGSNAVSTGRLVTRHQPEVSFNYEGSVRYYHQRLRAEVSVFTNEIKDSISKQALILPPGAVGQFLGGERITSQAPSGIVFVAASTNPVLVRANFGDARIWGVEHTFDATVTNKLSVGGVYTYIRAKEKPSGLPPNIEGGTPAPDGWLRVRYSANRRLWVEPYLHAARRQTRLSSLDLEDRRTGALRTRSSISNFFFNGATARGMIGPGADGRFGTADDILLATRETLTQVQDRVLGVGVSSAPLVTALPGYVTINVRAGLQLRENHNVVLDFENIADKNYRGISWGMDAPGRSVYVRYQLRF